MRKDLESSNDQVNLRKNETFFVYIYTGQIYWSIIIYRPNNIYYLIRRKKKSIASRFLCLNIIFQTPYNYHYNYDALIILGNLYTFNGILFFV